MKKLQLLTKLISVLFIFSSLYGQEDIIITIQKQPKTVDDFTELRNNLGNTPEGSAALTILAFDAYANDDPNAIPYLTLILAMRNLSKSNAPNNYKGYVPDPGYFNYHFSRIKGKTNFFKCYFKNNTLVFKRNQYSQIKDNQIKTFVYSNVENMMPRPITLERNDKGIWKAYELSSILLGCPEKNTQSDDL